MAFAHPFSASEASTELTVYTRHDQIVIFSDEEFTSDNGVVSGAGTSEDPYVIEGWDIDISDIEPGDGTLMGGIHIGNTWSSFVIRSVRIHGDYEPIVTQGQFSITGNPAIVMYFGANARIENCELTNTTDGITITRMSSVVIKNNTITGNGRGIRIDESSNLDVEDTILAIPTHHRLLHEQPPKHRQGERLAGTATPGGQVGNSRDWVRHHESDRTGVSAPG